MTQENVPRRKLGQLKMARAVLRKSDREEKLVYAVKLYHRILKAKELISMKRFLAKWK